MSAGRRPPGFIPGYMTEDLEMREVAGPPRYTSRTDKPVEHIALASKDGKLIGYLYANDEDDAAGWQPVASTSPEEQNLAAPWMRMLQNAKQRALKPGAALDELLRATLPNSRIVPGSRKMSASLDALRALAKGPHTPRGENQT
jgi:hypothetical protein